MTNQSLDGQLEKKEVEIPLPLKERLPENLEDFLVLDLSAKRSTYTKKLQLKEGKLVPVQIVSGVS